MRWLAKLWALQRRNWQTALTYPVSQLYRLVRAVALLVGLFFVGRLIAEGGPNPLLTRYGESYFRFVLLGLAFSQFMTTAQGSVNRTIGRERALGTLEAVLLSPTSFGTLALGVALWDLLVVTGRVALLLAAGVLLFGVDLSGASWSGALLASVLTVGAFFGLGLASAGLALVLREASPLDRLFGGFSHFLGGVWFPIALFPQWLQAVSTFVPLTYTLEAVRRALIDGAGPAALWRELLVLGVLALVCLPAGWLVFRWGWVRARRDGTLGFPV